MRQRELVKLKKGIKALRSGKYAQTEGALNNKDGFCCLGVMCSVNIPKEKLKLNDDKFIDGDFPSDQPKAPKWLKDLNNDFEDRTDVKLSTLNDDGVPTHAGTVLMKEHGRKKFTFDEIADLLEAVYVLKVLK